MTSFPHLRALLVLAGLLAAGISNAAPAASCPGHFAGGRAPHYLVAAYTVDTILLCNEGSATLYSGKTRTALWVGEYLTPERVRAARGLDRASYFKEDRRVPAAWRAQLSDYVHSGYDRGHLAP